MRAAKVAEYWKAVDAAPNRPIQIRQFAYQNISGLRDDVITFNGPLTVIGGLNGSGKSALLKALWATLSWESASQQPEVPPRLKGSKLTLTLMRDTEELHPTLTVDAGKTEPPIPEDLTVEHLDLARLAPHLQGAFCRHGAENLLDAYEAIDLDENEISLISQTCKKDFVDIKIYEIDEFENEILPFIRAEDGQSRYDIRTMSLGEISIITCYWALRRAKAGAIVLLEEPETYISPVSQALFIDLLVYLCVSRQISLVFTTHSPQMFSRLNKRYVKFFYRDAQGSKLAADDQFDSMRKLVGLAAPIDVAILVEDRAAREFTRLLLGRLNVNLASRTEIVDVGGDGNITTSRRIMSRGIRFFNLVGAYDGDMRGKIPESEDEWPFTFLPGPSAVERQFRALSNDNAKLLAGTLGREIAVLEPILAGLAGLDHHDWFEEFVKKLGMSYEQVMLACFEAWFAIDANSQEADEFITKLLERIR